MKTADIRESFLTFMESKGCTRRPSSSLIPEDPSLLLTSAGMVQFKPVFLGVKTLGFTRATTVQKCVRTTDIDIIGTTGRHLSFFEMLGNFSFGDYFKSEAITWAWEFSVDVLKLDPERIWASVFTDDDEAAELWLNLTGVPSQRIVRFGVEDNFWAAGPTGPCGPCSELYYDRGEAFSCGPDCKIGCECDRFVEYWNLVFMQYDRDADGNMTPLPKQNIDTGLGLERMAAILQDVTSNYEIDLMQDIMTLAQKLTGATYGKDERTNIALRIITDHSRAVAFLIADGVLPSNEGRGYVLRRLLRRAVRYVRLLGVDDPIMVEMVKKVIAEMGQAYPEIVQHEDLILGIVGAEEERFSATLRTGLSFLATEFDKLGEGETLSGLATFTLHDTYGFPYDLTVEIAGEEGIAVDIEGFHQEMKQQKERARANVKDESWSSFGGVYVELAHRTDPTLYVGDNNDTHCAEIVALIADGAEVDSLTEGRSAEVVLDVTPFYGEQGGQLGDHGILVTDDGAKFAVNDTQIKEKSMRVHIGTLDVGTLKVGQSVQAKIDRKRRERIRRNHTATHILHHTLRKVVGDHASQAGSAVAPDRLRFDFTHFEALTPAQIIEIERRVNDKIFEAVPVRAFETSLETAREQGVTALFGEKYGDFVRVVETGGFSKELCGGSHVGNTSEIGFLKITSESSVGANMRRIEAVTSYDAYDYVSGMVGELYETAFALRVPPMNVAERTAGLVARTKELEHQLKKALSSIESDALGDLDAKAHDAGGYRLIIAHDNTLRAAGLRSAWDAIRARGIDAVVIAGADEQSGKAIFLAAGNDAAVARGFNAGAIVKSIAAATDGRGGGKPNMAQGGSEDTSGIEAALVAVGDSFGLKR